MTSQFLTPKKRVTGLGSAKSGTHHFWVQRLTAIANMFLTIGVICIALKVVGKPYAEVITLFKNPLVAFVLLGFTFSVTTHMRLGMQIIIEDYVHTHVKKIILVVFNSLFTYGVALLTGFAILKIAFMN